MRPSCHVGAAYFHSIDETVTRKKGPFFFFQSLVQKAFYKQMKKTQTQLYGNIWRLAQSQTLVLGGGVEKSDLLGGHKYPTKIP